MDNIFRNELEDVYFQICRGIEQKDKEMLKKAGEMVAEAVIDWDSSLARDTTMLAEEWTSRCDSFARKLASEEIIDEITECVVQGARSKAKALHVDTEGGQTVSHIVYCAGTLSQAIENPVREYRTEFATRHAHDIETRSRLMIDDREKRGG